MSLRLRRAQTTTTTYRRERVERPGIREKRVRRDSVGHFGASRASRAIRSTRARSRFRKGFPFFFCPVTPQNDSENGKCSFLIGGGRKATNALLFGTHHKRFVVVSFSSEEVRSLPDFSRGLKKRSSRRRVRKKCGDDDDDLTTRFFFLHASVYPNHF